MKKTLVAIAAVSLLAMGGCAKIRTGDVGIEHHWGGTISQETAAPGFHWAILSSYDEIDVTPTRVDVTGMTPKDSNGVPLNDVDIVVTYTLNSDNSAIFYSTTHELDEYKDDSGNEYTTLGLHIVESVAPHAMQEVTSKDQLQNIAKNITAYEDAAAVEIKSELDAQYPGAYKNIKVRVNKFQLPDSIQRNENDMASMEAERQRNQVELGLIDQRTQLAEKNATMDAMALRDAADAAHLTPEQVIAWKQAEAAMTQAQGIAGVNKVVDVSKR